MSKTVKVAIYDRDLRVRIVKAELNKDGTKLKIKKGGKKHWYPKFDEKSYLEFPRTLGGYERIYIVRNHATACVGFGEEEEIHGPDPDTVEAVASASLLDKMGQDTQEVHWQTWIILATNIIVLMYAMGVIV